MPARSWRRESRQLVNIYLHTLQAAERRWRRSCCHDCGDCDDDDGVVVGDDSDCSVGGDGVVEKIAPVADAVATDVPEGDFDVECRDGDSVDGDDADDGGGGDGRYDDDGDVDGDNDDGDGGVDDDDGDDPTGLRGKPRENSGFVIRVTITLRFVIRFGLPSHRFSDGSLAEFADL